MLFQMHDNFLRSNIAENDGINPHHKQVRSTCNTESQIDILSPSPIYHPRLHCKKRTHTHKGDVRTRVLCTRVFDFWVVAKHHGCHCCFGPDNFCWSCQCRVFYNFFEKKKNNNTDKRFSDSLKYCILFDIFLENAGIYMEYECGVMNVAEKWKQVSKQWRQTMWYLKMNSTQLFLKIILRGTWKYYLLFKNSIISLNHSVRSTNLHWWFRRPRLPSQYLKEDIEGVFVNE